MSKLWGSRWRESAAVVAVVLRCGVRVLVRQKLATDGCLEVRMHHGYSLQIIPKQKFLQLLAGKASPVLTSCTCRREVWRDRARRPRYSRKPSA